MKVKISELTEEEFDEVCQLEDLLLEKSNQLSDSDLEGVSEKAIWFVIGQECGYPKTYPDLPETIEEAKERLCSDTIRKFKARRKKEIEHAVAMGIDVAWC